MRFGTGLVCNASSKESTLLTLERLPCFIQSGYSHTDGFIATVCSGHLKQ